MSSIMSMSETFLVYESISLRLEKLDDTPEKKAELRKLFDKMSTDLMNAAEAFQAKRYNQKQELT